MPLTEDEAAAVVFGPQEAHVARVIRSMMHIGTPDTVVADVGELSDRTRADEVMVSGDLAARLESYRLFMEAWRAR